MTQKNQVYKCEICGNIIEVLDAAGGTLVCCGQPMKLMQENTVDASLEKHVPVIEKTANGVKVKVVRRPNRLFMSNRVSLTDEAVLEVYKMR